MKKVIENLITFEDFSNNDFPVFKNDRERIKYMSNAYRKMNLVDAFKKFYSLSIDDKLIDNSNVNNVYTLEIGKFYYADVDQITKRQIVFNVSGIKDEVICKESFSMEELNNIYNYVINHNNKLLFEVREKKNNVYYVSIINAYYNLWLKNIVNLIKYNKDITVHIDELVRGGYICHTTIDTIKELTGRNYTHSVFIPGSHIVLNIENDFEQWIGKDVQIIPQKFVDYRKNYKTGEVEKSLVGSRKKVLQIIGAKNLEELYNKWKLTKDNENVTFENKFTGFVTGIINSQNKTGIFVEIKDKFITGLVELDTYDLIDYKPNDQVTVRISDFECKNNFEPFTYYKDKTIKDCNIRPIFEII